jgi:hypothetical protein
MAILYMYRLDDVHNKVIGNHHSTLILTGFTNYQQALCIFILYKSLLNIIPFTELFLRRWSFSRVSQPLDDNLSISLGYTPIAWILVYIAQEGRLCA